MHNGGCGPMLLAASMIVVIVACGISEVGAPDQAGTEEKPGISSAVRPVCCVSGFDYPPGFDWGDDHHQEGVKCSLVVFADGIPEIKVPVGDGYEVSDDPDMHRVIDGDLYTFYSKHGKTVMRRNGAPLFRYEGEEVLVDITVVDDNLFTLTHKHSGGFSYRKNGELLIERLSGETFGRFWNDGDSLCFAFRQPVVKDDGVEQRYYMVCDSNVIPVQIHEEADKIWDLMSENGFPCVLLSLRGTGDTFLFQEGAKRKIEIQESAEILACRLFEADSLIGVECVYEYPDGRYESGIWVDGSEYMRFEAGRSIHSLCYSEGKVYCILNPKDDEGIIFDNGEISTMPEGYYCINESVLSVHEGELYVAMTSKAGLYPLVWHGGQTDTLRLNGCVTSISFTRPNTSSVR